MKTSDLQRIRDLPTKPPYPPGLVEALTAELGTGTNGQTLKPLQAQALWEVCHLDGLVGFMPVGSGKTLTALLTPTLYPDCKRPLILTRASLLEQMRHDRVHTYGPHWRIRDDIIYSSYWYLSNHSDFLEKLNPDLIICDEAHTVAGKSVRTKRMWRWQIENEVPFIVLSGTMTRKELEDYWRVVYLALGNNSPIPIEYPRRASVGAVIDANGFPTRADFAYTCQLYGVDPNTKTSRWGTSGLKEKCREAYQVRLEQTRGIVVGPAEALGTNIEFELWHPPKLNQQAQQALTRLHSRWELPGGETLHNPLDVARVNNQLQLGFYYEIVWPGGVVNHQWLQARKEWGQYLRSFPTREGLDSPALIFDHALKEGNPYAVRWAQHKDFVPDRRVVWLDDSIVRAAVKDTKHTLWYHHIAVGEKLKELGMIVYGPGETPPVDLTTKPVAFSISAHGTGRNLQQYSKMLVLEPPSSGATWEQLVGRLHRPGQKADTVSVKVPAFAQDKVKTAKATARYIQETTGFDQKLLLATYIGYEC